MDIGTMSLNVNVKIKNMDRFVELNEEFNKKVRELEELARELKTFDFEGKVESIDSD